MTTTLDPRSAATVARVWDDIRTGRSWGYRSMSERSADRMSYNPPMRAESYGKTLAVIGTWVGSSDRRAAVARKIVPSIPLYGSEHQMLAAIAEAIGETLRTPYTDVIGRSGPEAGRPSDHIHAWTDHDRIGLEVLYAEIGIAVSGTTYGNVGWVLQHILTEEGFLPTAYGTPKVYAAVTKN